MRRISTRHRAPPNPRSASSAQAGHAPGCEKIIRYAFAYARAYGRKRVTCMTKDNIMKLTDGLFHEVFNEVAKEYPDIETDHYIIDIGSARLASSPEIFDVIVTLNLYGDILSDIAAQIAGSVGLASSANVGENMAMFEAVHGSAPDIAGQDIANPSGLLIAATQMLVHLGLAEHAELVKNAWLRTIEAGIHTADIYREGSSTKKVGTRAFADAVIATWERSPQCSTPVAYESHPINVHTTPVSVKKTLVGVDVFSLLDESDRDPDVLAARLEVANSSALSLKLITNRGVKAVSGRSGRDLPQRSLALSFPQRGRRSRLRRGHRLTQPDPWCRARRDQDRESLLFRRNPDFRSDKGSEPHGG